jgi:hypothetical protein
VLDGDAAILAAYRDVFGIDLDRVPGVTGNPHGRSADAGQPRDGDDPDRQDQRA